MLRRAVQASATRASGSPDRPATPRAASTLGDMTIQRMDHVSVVVDDLEAATAFFVELGMELEGEAPVEGRWVDRLVLHSPGGLRAGSEAEVRG